MRLNLDGTHLGQKADHQADDQQDQGRGDTHLGRDELTRHDNEHNFTLILLLCVSFTSSTKS